MSSRVVARLAGLNQVHPFAKVEINGVREQRYIMAVSVLEEDGSHDVASVTVRYDVPAGGYKTVGASQWTPSRFSLWSKQSPIKVTYGLGQNLGVFFGYVRGSKIVRRNSKPGDRAFADVEYILTGTSTPLMNMRSRSWGKTSASYIAKTIASDHGLRAVVDPHPLVQEFIQSKQSDFTYLKELADRVGYRLWVSGSTLYFTNPIKDYQYSSIRTVPAFRMDRRPNGLDSLRDFTVIDGEDLPEGGVAARRELQFMSEATGRAYSASNSALLNAVFNEEEGGPVTTLKLQSSKYAPMSYEEARKLIEAETMLNRNWLVGKATTVGNAQVHPGVVVDFQGQVMIPEYTGRWLVQKANHRLYRYQDSAGTWWMRYDMDLSVGRDLIARPQREIPAEWLQAVESVPAVLTSKGWRAAHLSGDVNGC